MEKQVMKATEQGQRKLADPSQTVPALPWAFREPDTRSASREALAMGLTRADPLETFLRPRLVTELRRLTSCFSAPENIFGTERPLSVVYSISPSPQLFFSPHN